MDNTTNKKRLEPERHPLECETIQPLLFDYMARELGDSRAALVREHVRNCERCRKEQEQIEHAIACLKESMADERPTCLSDRRRRRLMRLAANPVLNWLDANHRIVAMIITLIVLVLVLLAVRRVPVNTFEPTDLGETIPIWRYMRSGPLPERVKEAAARQRAAQSNSVDRVGQE